MTDPAASKVTAAEFVRNFAAVRQRAKLAPVLITNHGRDSHVLCSAEQFRALGSHREASGDEAVALDLVQLSAGIDQGLVLVDRACRILHANSALLGIVRCDPGQLAGMALLDALPELAGTLAEAYLRRTLERREGAVFEMPSPFRAEGWLQCRLAEVGDGIAILLRDITGEVRRLSIPDAQDEVLRAMAFNDAVAFVRLSLRAYIEEASAGFSALLGLSEDRLIGLHFCNLVDFKQREAVGDALEAVLGKGEGRTVAARLLNSRGELVAVTMGVAGTCGGYCRDGAGIVVSRCGGESVAPPVALLRQAR